MHVSVIMHYKYNFNHDWLLGKQTSECTKPLQHMFWCMSVKRALTQSEELWLHTFERKISCKIYSRMQESSEIQRKIQVFVNWCLIYILRIWWPNIISNKDLWRVTDQEDINLEIRKRKFTWIGHTLRKRGWGNIKSSPTMEPSRKQEERKT